VPTYSNGYVPEGLLIKFNNGYNDVDGEWWHGFPPATYAKHRALIARALRRTGRTLRLTLGWSAYRPYFAQVIARRVHGLGAATPGTSSHGGFWENRQTMAGDYGNWAWVYENHGGQAAFFEDCRAVGLTPGMIMRSRGYPDEPWHVIDLDPWGAVPAFEGVTPFSDLQPVEDDDMLMLNIAGKHLAALGPGVFRHFLAFDPYEKIKNLSRVQDDWQDVSFGELPSLLITYGCDEHIWDVRNGEFCVVDPLKTGADAVKPGNAWTAEKATRAAIAGIKVPPVDPSPIVDAVREAIAAVGGAGVDELAIADAVREKFRSDPLI
jgi:hypothetical protein